MNGVLIVYVFTIIIIIFLIFFMFIKLRSNIYVINLKFKYN